MELALERVPTPLPDDEVAVDAQAATAAVAPEADKGKSGSDVMTH